MGNRTNHVIIFIKSVLGVVDLFTLGMIKRTIPNVIVFHEISDSPSYFSKKNHTNIKVRYARRIFNHFTKKRIANLGYHHNIIFTFDDGFLSTLPHIKHLCDINAKVVIFLNSNTVITGTSEDEKVFEGDLKASLTNQLTFAKKSNFLNKEQIVSLHNDYPNLEIGDHLHKHLDCRSLSEQEFEGYLQTGRNFFNSFDVRPKSFAWPYGSENPLFYEILSRFGYEKVYKGGLRMAQEIDLCHLPRAQAMQTPFPTLYIKGALLLNRLLSQERKASFPLNKKS